MKRIILCLSLALLSSSAYCDYAFWTGRMNYLPNFDRVPIVECEYLYYGQKMWFTMKFTCENEVWIQ